MNASACDDTCITTDPLDHLLLERLCTGREPWKCTGDLSTGYVPDLSLKGAGSRLRFAELDPFLRVLLMTDGTVTKTLEAHHWEPIRVEVLRQEVVPAPAAIPCLEARAGESVLSRRVCLRGVSSGLAHAHAFSVVRIESLPEALRAGLLAGRLGIGELLNNSQLNTYREVLEMGLSHDRLDPAVDGEPRPGVYRIYRIFIQGRPGIVILEQFPLATSR